MWRRSRPSGSWRARRKGTDSRLALLSAILGFLLARAARGSSRRSKSSRRASARGLVKRLKATFDYEAVYQVIAIDGEESPSAYYEKKQRLVPSKPNSS